MNEVQSVPNPKVPTVYYRGRATGIAPILRMCKLSLWILLWLGVYWILDPGNRASLVHQSDWSLLERLDAAIRDGDSAQALSEPGRLLMLAFAAITALKIAWTWLGWSATRYLVTSERIQFEQGVFSKTIKSVDLWRIRDLIFQRGALEALFGVGSIVIVANDATTRYSQIGPIRQGRKLYDALIDARQLAIQERGVAAVES